MKKTLAESIRATLDLLTEAPAGMADALQDLHNESGGNPTSELAAEIGADYNITGEKLLAAYPQWVQTQAGKAQNTAPVDPKKEAQKQKWAAHERHKEREAEAERRKAEQEADKQAFRSKNDGLIKQIQSDMQAIEAPEGWSKDIVVPGKYNGKHDIGDMTFTNQAGNVCLVMHVIVCDPEAEEMGNWKRPEIPYEIHGDTKFMFDDKWYSFTDYSKWGDSFATGQYSNWRSFDAIPDIINHENQRAQDALDRKTLRGH
jgi:hypothetical protein